MGQQSGQVNAQNCRWNTDENAKHKILISFGRMFLFRSFFLHRYIRECHNFTFVGPICGGILAFKLMADHRLNATSSHQNLYGAHLAARAKKQESLVFLFSFTKKKEEESNTHNAINANERCRKWRRNSTNRIKQWILKCVRHGQEQGIYQTSEWINENMQPNDKMGGKKNSGELNETKRWK